MDLRALDDRVLPVAAARLRRLTARASRAAHSAGQGGNRVVALLRGKPVVSMTALAALVVAVAVAAATGKHGTGTTAVVTPNTSPAGYADVGPTAGQQVSDYLKAARHRLDQAAARKGAAAYAVVDFTRYLTPEAAGRAVAGLGVSRAYFKAKVAGVQTQPHTAVLQSMSQLAGAIAGTARIEKSASASFLQLAGAIPARTASEKQVKQTYAQQAAVAKIEAGALTPTCACVYALVVHGKVDALRALRDRGGVRVVDPAPPGIPLEGLGVIPLLPETTGTIPVPGRAQPPH